MQSGWSRDRRKDSKTSKPGMLARSWRETLQLIGLHPRPPIAKHFLGHFGRGNGQVQRGGKPGESVCGAFTIQEDVLVLGGGSGAFDAGVGMGDALLESILFRTGTTASSIKFTEGTLGMLSRDCLGAFRGTCLGAASTSLDFSLASKSTAGSGSGAAGFGFGTEGEPKREPDWMRLSRGIPGVFYPHAHFASSYELSQAIEAALRISSKGAAAADPSLEAVVGQGAEERRLKALEFMAVVGRCRGICRMLSTPLLERLSTASFPQTSKLFRWKLVDDDDRNHGDANARLTFAGSFMGVECLEVLPEGIPPKDLALIPPARIRLLSQKFTSGPFLSRHHLLLSPEQLAAIQPGSLALPKGDGKDGKDDEMQELWIGGGGWEGLPGRVLDGLATGTLRAIPPALFARVGPETVRTSSQQRPPPPTNTTLPLPLFLGRGRAGPDADSDHPHHQTSFLARLSSEQFAQLSDGALGAISPEQARAIVGASRQAQHRQHRRRQAIPLTDALWRLFFPPDRPSPPSTPARLLDASVSPPVDDVLSRFPRKRHELLNARVQQIIPLPPSQNLHPNQQLMPLPHPHHYSNPNSWRDLLGAFATVGAGFAACVLALSHHQRMRRQQIQERAILRKHRELLQMAALEAAFDTDNDNDYDYDNHTDTDDDAWSGTTDDTLMDSEDSERPSVFSSGKVAGDPFDRQNLSDDSADFVSPSTSSAAPSHHQRNVPLFYDDLGPHGSSPAGAASFAVKAKRRFASPPPKWDDEKAPAGESSDEDAR